MASEPAPLRIVYREYVGTNGRSVTALCPMSYPPAESKRGRPIERLRCSVNQTANQTGGTQY